MKRFRCYLNPWYDLKVVTVYGTKPDMPHYRRAMTMLVLHLSMLAFVAQAVLRLVGK